LPSVFDEAKTENGTVRTHWQRFFQLLDGLGPDQLTERWQKAQHLLHENGVSYNMYSDPMGLDRPWNLSPIPVLIARDEWQRVEAIIAQRARLIEALLHDLYGPQRTLIEGVIPPELVFANPYFLRACHGMSLPRNLFLPLYGVDLIRYPSG